MTSDAPDELRLNEMRLMAHEIILKIYEAKAWRQLELIQMQLDAMLKNKPEGPTDDQ